MGLTFFKGPTKRKDNNTNILWLKNSPNLNLERFPKSIEGFTIVNCLKFKPFNFSSTSPLFFKYVLFVLGFEPNDEMYRKQLTLFFSAIEAIWTGISYSILLYSFLFGVCDFVVPIQKKQRYNEIFSFNELILVKSLTITSSFLWLTDKGDLTKALIDEY